MGGSQKWLLLIDGVINIILGVLLLLYTFGLGDRLGIPKAVTGFYPSILGSVILGIGIALIIERYGVRYQVRGLGLGGAITINICGATVLLT